MEHAEFIIGILFSGDCLPMNPHLLAGIACGEDNQEDFSEPSILNVALEIPISSNIIEVIPKNGNLNVRSFPMLNNLPWVKVLPDLEPKVNTEYWRFPTPQESIINNSNLKSPAEPNPENKNLELDSGLPIEPEKNLTRVKPLKDMFQFKERLMYLLQPPIEEVFTGKEVSLPFKPFPYQIKGIAFLMPRKSALIADEMGLGKTIQVIISIRLLFKSGLLKKVLIACPKPLVVNWTRELKLWASDLPVEVICGNTEERKVSWNVSNTPVKLVNYELLTRDVLEGVAGKNFYDLMVIDEAQRIKTKDSKTAQAVCSVQRDRSWAMSGTPVENRHEDLIHIFEFVDPGRIPKDTPPKMLASLTSDSIIRRTKEEAAPDMPGKIIQDVFLDLTPPQKQAYDLAEKDGVIHLNNLGDTVTVQHVFELVMRLKQICNFDPRTGSSSKAEQLLADMEEVQATKSKAIVFSQWVKPLEELAFQLKQYNPLMYHGKIPHNERQGILDKFKNDPDAHVILMSYGTGSVGLNLQFTNYVFLFDRWWNPAIEDQAINRAHRLGQKSTVFVKRFISQKTIEERIAEVLDAKRRLFAEIIDTSGLPCATGLNEDEIFNLFNISPRSKKIAA
jgi:SNF2 family DNA or RNA helicase